MWIPLPPLDLATREAHFKAMTSLSPLRESPAALFRHYAGALLMVACSTLLGLAIAPRWGNSGVDLLYLPAVLAAASFAGLGPALLAALSAALAYNFFFTAPHLTFQIDNPNDVVTVVVLFAVAVVTSQLAASVRRQARRADANAARNATIAGLARRLLACTSEAEIAAVGTAEIGAVFACNAVLVSGAEATPAQLTPADTAAAALVLEKGEPVGRGLDRAVPTEWQFHPVRSGGEVLAAVGLARDDGVPPVRDDQRQLLDNLLDQLALALERDRAESEARELARIRERDQVRSGLLSSIGQDLGPRLKAIGAAVRTLRRSGEGDRTVVAGIGAETARIEQYLTNLLALGPGDDAQPIVAGNLSIDILKHKVLRDGAEVHLTPKEFALLAELAKHRGRILSHAWLLRTVWGPAQEGQIDYLRVAIRALRQKLEAAPSAPALIVNAPAVGYKLALPAG